MSKEIQPSAVASLSTNVNVGMDEVVSVFVSKWEKSLFERKKDLSDKIKQVKDDLKIHTTSLENSVDTSKYEMKIPELGIASTIDSVNVSWADRDEKRSKDNKSEIIVRVEIADTANSDRWRSTLDKKFITPISKADVKKHNDLEDELSDLNGELIEVMGLIKSVSRKEREIRGAIAERKLQESGLQSLLEDDSMLQLVKLD